jgi:hypothetical protein
MSTLTLRRSAGTGAIRRRLREARRLLDLTASTWILALLCVPLMAASLAVALLLTEAPAPLRATLAAVVAAHPSWG